MPIDYECKNCKLGFRVGPYHYHNFGNGYFGRDLLVCQACGCQHSLELPIPDSGFPYVLESLSELLIDSKKFHGTMLFPEQEWANRTPIPNRDLAGLHSQHCGTIGSLIDVWPENGGECPKCAEIISEYLSFWMT